jgi:hypothetical protein
LSQLSLNRTFFHNVALPNFIKLLKPNSAVLDIGVSQAHGDYYRRLFKDFTYKTLDRNPNVGADIIYDIELGARTFKFQGVIAMGTWEQATNPFKMFDGIYNSLDDNGLALFGVVGLGYPEYSCDKFRFTNKGFRDLLAGKFDILDFNSVGQGIPEYYFYICKKSVKTVEHDVQSLDRKS